MPRPPVVLVTACNRQLGEHPFHVAGRKYVDAVRLAGALPLIAPPCPEDQLDALLGAACGVLLTGSASNVHPRHYGAAVDDASLPLDEARDDWTLSLIRRVLDRGMPLLAICRGAQEVNVALGGSLHQALHATPGFANHRAPDGGPAAVQYAASHPVTTLPGGLLAAITGRQRFDVNSVHGQGIARLAPGLRAEAHAPDGLVEAFTLPSARGFNLSVQWHPEWRAAENPVSMSILRAFGGALTRPPRELRSLPPTGTVSTFGTAGRC